MGKEMSMPGKNHKIGRNRKESLFIYFFGVSFSVGEAI